MENQKGVNYDKLFGEYLQGAKNITLTDPYLRIFFQLRNLMEFIETVIKFKDKEDEVHLHIITAKEDRNLDGKKDESLEQIQETVSKAGINLTWEYDETNTIHARHIIVDNSWKISLDRGLDIFQNYEMNNAFELSNRMQDFRSCKGFEVTYIKL
jgi:ATP-dependent Lon protease